MEGGRDVGGRGSRLKQSIRFLYLLITERFPLTTKTNYTGTHPLHLDHHVSTMTHAREVASQGSQSIISSSNLLMKKNI